jgi:hypothetical protein
MKSTNPAKKRQRKITPADLAAKHPKSGERIALASRFPLENPVEFTFTDSSWRQPPVKKSQGVGTASFILSSE